MSQARLHSSTITHSAQQAALEEYNAVSAEPTILNCKNDPYNLRPVAEAVIKRVSLDAMRLSR